MSKKKKSKIFKRLQVTNNDKSNLFIIGASGGEEREARRQEFLDLLTTLDCKPEIKVRSKCPDEVQSE